MVKRHKATIEQSRRAKEIMRQLMNNLGDVAPYVYKSYFYMRVGEKMGISPRTVRTMINDIRDVS